MIGPGRYDDLCTLVRERTGARGVILIVLHETRERSGFSMQADASLTMRLPEMLEKLAEAIRDDLNRVGSG